MPTPSPWQLRPLSETDVTAWRQLRLTCITQDPECFCTTLTEAQHQTSSYYQHYLQQAQRGQVLLTGAFDAQQQLLGCIAIEPLSGTMRQHRMRIWGLMVAPSQRRRGIAQALCLHTLSQARQYHAEKVSLELTHAAQPALALYKRLGFNIEAVEPKAFKLNGQYLEQIQMAVYF